MAFRLRVASVLVAVAISAFRSLIGLLRKRRFGPSLDGDSSKRFHAADVERNRLHAARAILRDPLPPRPLRRLCEINSRSAPALKPDSLKKRPNLPQNTLHSLILIGQVFPVKRVVIVMSKKSKILIWSV